MNPGEGAIFELITKGGGWGVAAAVLWVFWRIWKEVKPSLLKWLELRHREVTIHERSAKAREDSVAAARETNSAVQGLTRSVDNLSTKVTAVMNNGFKRITDKIAHSDEGGN